MNRLTVVVQVSVVLNKTSFNDCDLTFQLPVNQSQIYLCIIVIF